MEISSPFDPLPFTDYARSFYTYGDAEDDEFRHYVDNVFPEQLQLDEIPPNTDFFDTFEEDEDEFRHYVDNTFPEQRQLEEGLKAPPLTSEISSNTKPAPVEMAAESSLRSCQCCNRRNEDNELIDTQKCGHFVCWYCFVVKRGNCPVLGCAPAPKSDTFKQFLPKDLSFIRKNAPSTDPNPNLSFSNGFSTKMDLQSTKLTRKHRKANASSVRNKTIDGRKDKGPNQVYSFRELSQWIEDNTNTKAVTLSPAAKPCRKWKRLIGRGHEIVWPPMVAISYTMHERDENSAWIGMTNQELLEMFSTYDGIAEAQSCYHVEGSLGMSMLVFESSVMGYLEANRLNNHFADQGTDRKAWKSKSIHVLSSREKQLYGYLALKEDVDTFNRNTQGTSQLKYEMKSYQEMVVNQIKQMCDENHQLVELRKRVDEHEIQAKEYGMLKEKLKLAKEESVIMRLRVTEQHQQHVEEVECQEQFYKEKIRNILESVNTQFFGSEIAVEVCNAVPVSRRSLAWSKTNRALFFDAHKIEK